jgi:sirohydrochlorin ferrochelatase
LVDETALIVMVHGSPMTIANEDMFRVVDMVRARNVFATVSVGFMECNEPTIPTAIQQCILAGATKVVAVPYFLHVGTHVADDLPILIEQARERYPDVEFAMGGYIGASPYISEILAQRVEAV